MNIVVLSRNPALYSTQAIVEAARIRNHHVRVIDHVACDLVIGPGKPQVLFNNHPVDQVDAIIPRIGAAATSYGVAVIRQFLNQGVFSTLQPDALLSSRDKLSSLQVLSAHGIRVPKTVYVSNVYTIPNLLREVAPYPVIIKLASGTQGMGVILAESENNATSVLEAFQTTGEKVILQKFIKEARGVDIRAFVVDGAIAGAMKRKARSGDFRSNLHRGGTAETVSLTPIEEKTAIEAAHALGLHIAGVDMLRSHSGPMVLEVNASPGLEGIENSTGIDIAAKIISFVEKNIQ